MKKYYIKKQKIHEIIKEAVEIENDIVDTFSRWLPFVQLQDIKVDIGNQDKTQIKINITFNIRNAPTELQSVGVVLE